MEYNYLGGTGLKVSRVCMGTMTFGSKMPQQNDVDRAVALAMDTGINFFDTADQYVDGKSEEMLGKALGNRRKDVVIASKVGYPCMEKKEFSLSRSSILDGVDGSLKRLGTDYLDIYYLHSPDYNTPLEESLEALNDVVRQGKVRYVGMSNYAAWQMCEAVHICKRNRWAVPVVSETCYNALTRGAENELVPFLREKKIGMTVFNPLAGGMLTGKHKRGVPTVGTRFENPNYQKRYWREDNFKAIDQLTQLADRMNTTLLSLSYRWCLSQPWVSSIITGFSNLEQLQANLAAMEGGALPEEALKQCDEVWESINGGRVQYNR
ncbi:aldo/keto reductase [Lawsonibacter sp. LCP25S3_G6]|uniref:aldo/keto reductase n=1 Tax=unclassified Lawsonibacter TaxID=2617946 RepID=UPI003F968853